MSKSVKNIIIGAGPAGLQLGYFMEKAGVEYVILERNEMAGSFFNVYPHSGKLISINKKYTGTDDPEFNLRHDWNSLLSENGPRFTSYSEDYYPDHRDLVTYLNDFATKNKLNILYRTAVKSINKLESSYEVVVSDDLKYNCENLIVATGLGKPLVPAFNINVKDKVKHYAEYGKDYFKKKENLAKFRNKSTLIIGNGNSGFELGSILKSHCSNIILQGRSTKNWASSTHYTGDLRAIYAPFLETFLLKSQNAVIGRNDNIAEEDVYIDQAADGGKYTITKRCGVKGCSRKHPYLPEHETESSFDHIIFCTGWKFDTSIFNFGINMTPNEKYPLVYPNYQSNNNKNLYFIGALMHSFDYKKSSGGFIHGFRYLIKHFFNMNYDNKFEIDMFDFNSPDNTTALIDHILYKMNNSSAMYQMYGQMGDLICYNTAKKKALYYNNVSVRYISHTMFNNTPDYLYMMITLEYGESEFDTQKLGIKRSSQGKESHSKLLHPVIRVFKEFHPGQKGSVDEIHFDEDLTASFTLDYLYRDKLTRTLKMFFS
jgi:thioredoxin reductase